MKSLLLNLSTMTILLSMLMIMLLSPTAYANGEPTSVTIAGSLQSEIGCSGDWQPDCASAHLTYNADDDVWQNTWTIPAGSWEYKATLNDSWDLNYGQNATQSGANIPLNLSGNIDVKFYYDNKTHWVTDNVNSVIAVAVGSFQSELGASGDWDPSNLRSWLQDPNADGLYTFSTTAIPAGAYEAKVAINENWDVNYGANGLQNGPNIPFVVPSSDAQVDFTYDSITHVLTISVVGGSGSIVVNTLAAGGDGTFEFVTTGGSGLPETFSITTVNGFGTLTFTDVASGTYSISELPKAGWTLSIATSDAGTPESLTVTAGGTTTCNFVNQKSLETGAESLLFWQNKTGQTIIRTSSAPNSPSDLALWLRGFNPYLDLSANARSGQVAAYVLGVIKTASAKGSTMNAILKAHMLSTALSVYFSDPLLGGNALLAPDPIGDNLVDLTRINKPIGSATYINVSSAFGGANQMSVMDMLNFAAGESNQGGTTWYQNIKTTQELAKDAFNAINNEKTGLTGTSYIGFANLQWPPTITHTISTVNRTDNVYGQVWIDKLTSLYGPTPTLRAQLGMGPEGSLPDANPDWIWVDAVFNTDAGNNDEFVASLLPETTGTFDYLYRYSFMDSTDWFYADLQGPVSAGTLSTHPGKLTVSSSGDTLAPAVPTGLMVTSTQVDAIDLTWDAVLGDSSLYGYEVARSLNSSGPYTVIARVTSTGYADPTVEEDETYYYVVRALDLSFNRSAFSGEVSAVAADRIVTLIFNLTVPASTDGTGRFVSITGNLSSLEGGYSDWNPSELTMTRIDATHWTVTLTGKEFTALEYRYTLGNWDYVEKGEFCEEVGNRQLTLIYGISGIQTINDTVLNWRNVGECTD
jgi:hypothetical protein